MNTKYINKILLCITFFYFTSSIAISNKEWIMEREIENLKYKLRNAQLDLEQLQKYNQPGREKWMPLYVANAGTPSFIEMVMEVIRNSPNTKKNIENYIEDFI